MKKYLIITTALVALSSPTFANGPGNNGGGNGGCGVGQQTNGCGGVGGAGGSAVASAIQGQVQGQAQGQFQGQSSYNRNTNTNANVNANSNSNRNSNRNTANSASASRGGDQSQSQSVDNSGVGSNSNNYTQSGIPVSSAVAPSFAIGSCQWAFSGGLQLFGAGVSAGSAGMYEFCKALMKSKHMSEQGKGHVAKALECQDSSIRAAYKSVGDPCIEDMPRVASNGAPAQALVPVVSANNTLPPNCKVVQPGNYITCQ